MTEEFNPETASLEELRARADQEPSDTPTEEPKDQKRNADGTFAPAADPADQPDEQTVLYTRRIDLGDGSGIQVFTADSLEGLVDKLTEAQLNATKKIRELNASLPKPVTKRERTADEEFVLSQELMTKPSKAFEKMFQDVVGMPIDTFKTKLDKVTAFEAAQAANQAANDFVTQTPDYFANPANGKKMQDYLRIHNLKATVENMTAAFGELNSAGLLQAKPAAQTEEVTTETPVAPVTKPTPAPQRRSSGLSTRGTTTTVRPTQNGPTEDELYSMPLDKLRELGSGRPDPRDF